MDSSNDNNRPAAEVMFGPVPTFGPSMLGASSAMDKACCRLFYPIYMPSNFVSKGDALDENGQGNHSEAGVLMGYLLCECDRKLGGGDVTALLAVTKLAAFIALAHSRRYRQQLYHFMAIIPSEIV